MRASLVSLPGGNITSVEKTPFCIGRDISSVDLCIAEPVVSRNHCKLLRKQEGWYVVDLDSTNRTYVNGVTAQPGLEVRLHHGDMLQLAQTRYRFEEVL